MSVSCIDSINYISLGRDLREKTFERKRGIASGSEMEGTDFMATATTLPCTMLRCAHILRLFMTPLTHSPQVPPGPRHRSSEIDPKRCAVEQIARGEAIRLWTTAIVHLHAVVFDRLSAFCRRFRKLTWTAESLQHRFHCTSLNVREISSGVWGRAGRVDFKRQRATLRWNRANTACLTSSWYCSIGKRERASNLNKTWSTRSSTSSDHLFDGTELTTPNIKLHSWLQEEKHQNTQKSCTMSYHISKS